MTALRIGQSHWTHWTRRARWPAGALAMLWLAACTVGPDYVRPSVDAPQAWRTAPDPGWRVADPGHAPLQPDWWRTFGIARLDDLEQQALDGNQTLRAASAHYEQAQATLASVASTQAPQVDLNGGLARERVSADRPQTNYATPNTSTVQNDVTTGIGASYDIDLFGRIRREVEAQTASTEQASDDLANARLVVTTDLATAYFALRELDAEIDVLDRSTVLQQKALAFVTAQHDSGAVSGLDVLQQQSELDATRTQRQLLVNQRAQFDTEIAALIGVPAPQFTIAPAVELPPIPVLPTGMPSDLLQRRPDVASAERAMAAANASIGVARAAYFPDLTLSPQLGWESTRFASLFGAPALAWSIGASAGEVLFDGGKRAAGVAFARAGYVAAEANYRQTVLDAFQQVQRAVTGLAVLDDAHARAHEGVVDAQHLLSLANDRYAGGLTAFINVLDAEQQLLTAQRTEVQIAGDQAALVVQLAKALGGGWRPDAARQNGGVGQTAQAAPATPATPAAASPDNPRM